MLLPGDGVADTVPGSAMQQPGDMIDGTNLGPLPTPSEDATNIMPITQPVLAATAAAAAVRILTSDDPPYFVTPPEDEKCPSHFDTGTVGFGNPVAKPAFDMTEMDREYNIPNFA